MADENAFVKALAEAQAEMDNAAFDKTNPHFKSKYASLASVRAATRALHKHGFAVISTTEFSPVSGFVEKTELAHVSGESRFSYWPINEGNTQQKGSDNTYGRRYGLSGFANIASEEDDDGNAASGPKPKSAHKARQEGFYPIAQEQIRALPTLTALKEWWIQNQHEIKQLPPQWRELLDEEKDRRKLELADEIGPGDMSSERLRASIVLSEEENEVIEGSPDVTTNDPQAFLDDLDSQMSGAKDEHTVMEVWNEYAGIMEALSPADKAKADMIWERHLRSVRAGAAAKAMRDKKK